MKSKLTGNSLGFVLIYFKDPENTKLAHTSLLNSRLDNKNIMVEFPISPKQNDGLSSKPSTLSTIPLSTPRSTPQLSPEVPNPGAGSPTFSFEKVDPHFLQAHCQQSPDNVERATYQDESQCQTETKTSTTSRRQ
jgi:hypothetical protein